mmetsp:Transcript_21412/g.36807  ORF Transcript_21412/g.36807 Transcript_21412/m.36807 type:complete len:302 (+) Transcript_21412:133-1038(+)|eukprot:CAMPEP_0184697390 /NCGR_PEP_ID=MMETSP0313-20130426/4363_1 /TAXON_ID=2792 /ORGANISM="Porphyridium aerugineum, Strain SAG 1380-2" /LENGTH=301 /DNA_ID=CAMNT_0027156175 /DNA_START=112 /DNA_END=1017 /DNA_ORIENTATION=+
MASPAVKALDRIRSMRVATPADFLQSIALASKSPLTASRRVASFYENIPYRILGLDVSKSFISVAISDSFLQFAAPFGVLNRVDPATDAKLIRRAFYMTKGTKPKPMDDLYISGVVVGVRVPVENGWDSDQVKEHTKYVEELLTHMASDDMDKKIKSPVVSVQESKKEQMEIIRLKHEFYIKRGGFMLPDKIPDSHISIPFCNLKAVMYWNEADVLTKTIALQNDLKLAAAYIGPKSVELRRHKVLNKVYPREVSKDESYNAKALTSISASDILQVALDEFARVQRSKSQPQEKQQQSLTQ